MTYDIKRLRWVLTRRYYGLLGRLDARKLGTSAPSQQIIESLVNRILADGLICHYCGHDLNLYAHAYDYKMALSLDHKVPLSMKPDNTADNLIVCCTRCNFAKGTMRYEEFKAMIYEMKIRDRFSMEKYLDNAFNNVTLRQRHAAFSTQQR